MFKISTQIKSSPLFQSLKIAIALLFLFILGVTPSLAAGNNNQSNQDINQPATLISPEPSFKINIYPQPNLDSQRIGYGLGGDPVMILEQVGSNNNDDLWDLVRFENAAKIEGWVRQKYVSVAGDLLSPQVKSTSDGSLDSGRSVNSEPRQKRSTQGSGSRQQNQNQQY